MKRFLSASLLFVVFLPAISGEESPWWLSFERGKQLFREKRFGESLIEFRSSVNVRRDTFEKARERFAKAMETKEAKRNGDSLDDLVALFAKADFRPAEFEAMREAAGNSYRTLFEEIEKSVIRDSFQNFLDSLKPVLDVRDLKDFRDSLERVSRYIELQAEFPEAEYWIGLIMREEAEYEAAERQFEKALTMVESLEIADTKYSILSSLAELSMLKGDSGKALARYRAILENDPEYATKTEGNARMKQTMLDMLKNKSGRNPVTGSSGFDKFMSIYRLKGLFAADAYRLSGIIEFQSGRYEEAMVCFAFGTNIVAAKIIEEFKAENVRYSYSGLAVFLRELDAYPGLVAYADKMGLFEMIYMLALSMYADSDPQARTESRYLWRILSGAGNAGAYAAKSARQATTPDLRRP